MSKVWNLWAFGPQVSPRWPSQSGNASTPNVVTTGREEGTLDDGFMPARRSNRRSTPPLMAVVFQAGESIENLGRNLREITRNTEVENITLSNSFGKLDEEMVQPENRELEIFSEADKENQPNILLRDMGESTLRDREEILRGTEGSRDIEDGRKLDLFPLLGLLGRNSKPSRTGP